jgi:hypothetical protein
VQIVIAGDTSGVPWVNVFWAGSAVSGTPTRAQMDTLATSLLGTYQSEFRPMANVDVLVSSCTVNYYDTGGAVIPGFASNPLAGTRAGGALPASTAGVVNWHTNFDHYRGGHARTYIPGPVTSDMATTSAFSTLYTAALATHASAWRTAINAYAGAPFTSLTFSMLSRIRGKQPLAVPVLRSIIGQTVRSIIGTQRRRLT